MMIGKSILFAVVLVVLHVSAESCSDGIKNLNEVDVDCGGVCGPCAEAEEVTTAEPEAGVTCTYEAVAPEECPNFGCVLDEDIDPDEYFIDGLHYDYDCNNIGECPMVPTEANEGLVCEADAQAYMAGGVTEYDVYVDLSIRPEGTDPDLDNCKLKDVYRVVCVAPAAASCDDGIKNQGEVGIDCGGPCDLCKECSYVANDDCLRADWGCDPAIGQNDANNDEYIYSNGEYIYSAYDTDCANIPNCPATPYQSNEGVICEADAMWALGTFPNDNLQFPGGSKFSDVDQTMPEGTDAYLDNCDEHDIYEVVCVDAPTTTTELETTTTTTTTTELETTTTTTTTTELETTTSAPTELCETYVTAASCPASYCVIKNDRHGDFKKCKRIQCKTFSADEAACEASAECQPKYKFGAFINKCLLKKNLGA